MDVNSDQTSNHSHLLTPQEGEELIRSSLLWKLRKGAASLTDKQLFEQCVNITIEQRTVDGNKDNKSAQDDDSKGNDKKGDDEKKKKKTAIVNDTCE